MSAAPDDSTMACFTGAHRLLFRESGLTPETIELGGWYRETDAKEIARELRFARTPAPAWAFPYFDEHGERLLVRYRPDRPREGRGKYAQPKGSGNVPYIHPSNYADGRLRDGSRPLVFTEGEKKAGLLTQLGYPTIGAGGVDGFHEKQSNGAKRLHTVVTRNTTFGDRPVLVCFDSDAHDKPAVMGAARRLAHYLRGAGATGVIRLATPPRVVP